MAASLFVATAMLGQFAAIPAAPTAAPPGNEVVKVHLALERAAFPTAGATNLAVIFDIDPGWHLYWRNPGESGLPPSVEFAPIDGVTFGDPQWPAPQRKVEAKTLVDYIFERQLVLIIPVTLDKHFAGGDTLTISADVDWLVCKERCIPGRTTVSATFPVAADGKPSADAPLFAATRKNHPRRATAADNIETRWSGRELMIHADDAKQITFFPYENDEGVYPADMVRRGSAKADALRLQYPDDVTELKTVAGVLAITRGGDETVLEISVKTPDAK